MGKRLLTAGIILSICFFVGGCSFSGSEYNEIKSAMEKSADLASGKIIITSQLKNSSKSDEIRSDFIFLQTPSGKFSYCHKQLDRADKIVFCEMSDGERAEQWLIGRGFSTIDPPQYTKAEPHRFVKLISTPMEKKAVDKIEMSEADGCKTYTVTMKPDTLNETTYSSASVTVVSQTITITIDANGVISRYLDTAKMLDTATAVESVYTLDMTLSMQNEITEITRPELRDYTPTKI